MEKEKKWYATAAFAAALATSAATIALLLAVINGTTMGLVF